jgi:hypothetical protein
VGLPGPSRAERAAGRAGPGAAWAPLGPGAPRAARAGHDLARLRLPGDAAGRCPLRRTGARRPGVGRAAVGTAGRRRPAGAGDHVLRVPGPARQPATDRRGHGHPAGPGPGHDRAGAGPGVARPAGQRDGPGGGPTARCSGTRRWW